MPHLYPHKRHGWQVLYRIHLPDGAHQDKTRYSKKKQTGQQSLVQRSLDLAFFEERPRKHNLLFGDLLLGTTINLAS